jgi:hypothetical protein
VTVALQVDGGAIRQGRVFEIAEDSTVELSYLNSGDVMKTVEKPMSAGAVWEFPAASVSVLELEIAQPAFPEPVTVRPFRREPAS